MNALIVARGFLRGLNWAILVLAVTFAGFGLLSPKSEETTWGGLAATFLLGALTLYFVRHPYDWDTFLADAAALFPEEKREDEAPTHHRRSA